MNIKDYVRISYKLVHLIFWMIVGYLSGDSGMGLYFCAFVIFYLTFTLLIGGVKETVARMVSKRIAKGFHSLGRSIFRFGILYSVCAGTFIGLIFWFGSTKLISSFAGYSLPSSILNFLGILYIIYSVSDCLMGYYQGMGEIFFVLISQVTNMIVLLISAPIIIKKTYLYGNKVGALLKNSLYANINGAMGAVFAQLLASFIALIILIVGGILTRDRELDDIEYRGADNRHGFKRSFIKSSITISLCRIFSILALATIVLSFIKTGYKLEVSARDIFTSIGVFADKFLLTISFGFIFFIDYVDREKRRIIVEYKRDEHRNLRNRCSFLLKNTAFMMLPLCLSVIVLAKPIVMIFFGGKMSMGVTLVRQGGIVIIFMAIAYSCKAILSAIEYDNYVLISGGVGYLAMIAFLTAALKGGLNISYLVYAYIVFYIVQAGVSLFLVYRLTDLFMIDIGMKVAKVAIGSFVMIIVEAIIDKLLVLNVPLFIFTIIISVITYYIVVGVLRGITNKDIGSLKGSLSYYPAALIGGFFNNNR